MIVIIDYGLGNLASVLNMFRKIGIREVCISSDPEVIRKADKLLLPGVGAFDAGMKKLEATGLIGLLNEQVLVRKVPVLGICLGMQLLGKKSEEGEATGLNWIEAETIKFRPDPALKLKVPNMGWSYVKVKIENPLLALNSHHRFYFVHSYHVVCQNVQNRIADADFGLEFTCMLQKDNVFGAQFHPEKSLRFGMQFLDNFAKL